MTSFAYRTAIAAILLELAFGLAAAPAEEMPPLIARETLLSRKPDEVIDSTVYQQRWNWRGKKFFSNPTALAICTAIETGDLETIDRLIKEGFDINHRGEDGMTILLYSLAFPGGVTRHLLERHADPNLPLDPGWALLIGGTTATQIIAGYGSPDDFQYILDHGTNPHLICADTYLPLIRFAFTNPTNCKILLAKGADINQQGAYRGGSGYSNAHIAYPTTSPDSLLLYLKAGGDYRRCDLVLGNLILNLAGYEDRWTQEQVFSPPERWEPVVEWFKSEKHIDPSAVLRKYREYEQTLGDHFALRSTRALADPEPWLPLEEDREKQFFDDPQLRALARAIDRNDVDEIERLADAGVDFKAMGKCGVTPLFWATRANLPTFMAVLGASADPNAQLTSTFFPRPNEYLGKGDTVVHWAVRYGQFEHLLFLLQAGADPNTRRAYCQWTPLFETLSLAYIETDMGQAVENVVGMYGDPADLPKRWRAEHRLLAMSVLKLAGADFDAQDVWGRTPVMLASKQHKNALTFMLLQFGASCRSVDKMGYDLMLMMIQDKRYYAWNCGAKQTPQKHQGRRDYWDEEHAEIMAIIKQRGGDFELAEKTVWKGDDWRPAIDLTTLTPEDRKWLPANESGFHGLLQTPEGKKPFPGIIELGTLPVSVSHRRAERPKKVDSTKSTGKLPYPNAKTPQSPNRPPYPNTETQTPREPSYFIPPPPQ